MSTSEIEIDDRTAASKVVDEATMAEVPSSPRRSMLADIASRFAHNRAAVLAGVVLILFALAAAFAPLVAPYDPNETYVGEAFTGPSADHWLGTDDIGRDLMSRLIFGARLSLGAALISVTLGAAIGIVPGLIAGYRGGWLDVTMSRIVDAVMCIPGLILSISLVAALGPGMYQVAIAVGVSFGPRFYRVARAAAMGVSTETYIKAAHGLGSGSPRILFRHVVPNALPPLIVQGSLMFGFGLLAEASLSFLGLGPQAPEASWGSLLRRGTQFMTQAQYLTIVPGLLIVAAVLAANVVGDGLQSVLGVRRNGDDGA